MDTRDVQRQFELTEPYKLELVENIAAPAPQRCILHLAAADCGFTAVAGTWDEVMALVPRRFLKPVGV